MIHKQQAEDLLQLIERISYLIQRGRFCEVTYSPITTRKLRENENTWLSALWTDVTSLYEAILKIFVLICRKLEKPKGLRIIEGVFKPQEVSSWLNELKELNERIGERSEYCFQFHSQEFLSKLVSCCEDAESFEASRALSRVSDLPFQSYHEVVQRQRAPGTCAWILQDQNYKDWKSWIFRVAMLYGPRKCTSSLSFQYPLDDDSGLTVTSWRRENFPGLQDY